MNFKVQKEVVPGEHFLEHQFNQVPVSLVGVWRKCGQRVCQNLGTEQFLCNSCLRLDSIIIIVK